MSQVVLEEGGQASLEDLVDEVEERRRDEGRVRGRLRGRGRRDACARAER